MGVWAVAEIARRRREHEDVRGKDAHGPVVAGDLTPPAPLNSGAEEREIFPVPNWAWIVFAICCVLGFGVMPLVVGESDAPLPGLAVVGIGIAVVYAAGRRERRQNGFGRRSRRYPSLRTQVVFVVLLALTLGRTLINGGAPSTGAVFHTLVLAGMLVVVASEVKHRRKIKRHPTRPRRAVEENRP